MKAQGVSLRDAGVIKILFRVAHADALHDRARPQIANGGKLAIWDRPRF